MVTMKVKFRSWYSKNEKGNYLIPFLTIGFNKNSFFISLLGFSISIGRIKKKQNHESTRS